MGSNPVAVTLTSDIVHTNDIEINKWTQINTSDMKNYYLSDKVESIIETASFDSL